MTTRISIVMPAHNAREYIARSVKSALEQTLRDIELIVIDDGSTDDTVFVATNAARGDSRFKLIKLETNRGPGAARNAGLDAASGEWIALLDADDTFAPVRLQRMLRMAEERGADLLSDNLVLSATPGSAQGVCAVSAEFMTRQTGISAAEFIAMDRPGYGTRAVGFLKPIMRAEFLHEKRLRYDTTYRNGEDFHFYVKALLEGARLFVTPDAWYQYWFRPGSQCRGVEACYPQQLIAANEDLLRIAEEHGDRRAASELRKRRQEIDFWIPYASFVADLKQRNHVKAMQSFYRLPSQAYALRRLGEAGIRRIRGAPELKLLAG